jgi:L,D-peptidoglycan transpeptidase YkuD (ErfK/YbiS/YcfS/YnhG family)
MRRGFYREDKMTSDNRLDVNKNKIVQNVNPFTPEFFQMNATRRDYGWCDASNDPDYNQFVYLPYSASHEQLWLADSVAYDLMVVIGYNDDPVIPGGGSAIFFHVTESYGSTAGCVALRIEDLKWVLSRLEEDTMMTIN